MRLPRLSPHRESPNLPSTPIAGAQYPKDCFLSDLMDNRELHTASLKLHHARSESPSTQDATELGIGSAMSRNEAQHRILLEILRLPADVKGKVDGPDATGWTAGFTI